MILILTSENLTQYLQAHKLFDQDTETLIDLRCVSSKNFNLVATFDNQRSILVKQKRLNSAGQFNRDFYDEWRVHQLIEYFANLAPLKSITTRVLHYDPINAILVTQFFSEFLDLRDYHDETNCFPIEIGVAMGKSLAKFHRLTYQQLNYYEFLVQSEKRSRHSNPKFLGCFDRPSPDIFGTYCQDGIEFFRILQPTFRRSCDHEMR